MQTQAGGGLEAAIADFVNVLEFWTRVAESFGNPPGIRGAQK